MENQFVSGVRSVVKHWYLSLIIGILFIFVGIVVLVTPMESYLALSILFSVTFFISGIFEIVYSIVNRNAIYNWGWILFAGIVDLLFGILLMSSPLLSANILPIYIGFMLLFRSIVTMANSFDLKNMGISGWGWMLALGIVCTLLSFIMIWNPAFGGMTIIIWTALAFIAIGIFRIFLSFKLKKIKNIATM